MDEARAVPAERPEIGEKDLQTATAPSVSLIV
jgi:hypothetical protein